MQKSESINELATALCIAQSQIEGAKKESQGYNYKYANLDVVLDCLKKPFKENGLSYVQSSRMTESGNIVLVTVLMHKSGQWISGEVPVKESTKDGQKLNELQVLGSALSYMRRYAISAMCGIAQTDDDAASFPIKQPQHNQSNPTVGTSRK